MGSRRCLIAGLFCTSLLLGCGGKPESSPAPEATPSESGNTAASESQAADSPAASPAAEKHSVPPFVPVDPSKVDLTVSARAINWPQFRGPDRDAICKETGLLRKWPEGGPKVLWETPVCEGYAAAAIFAGKVYFNDYDETSKTWMVRCLALKGGEELWRFGEQKPGRGISPNHGITRTVPAVDGKYVFSLDPKCVFHCLDAETGKELWQKVIPDEYGSTPPGWYAGQCPLIEDDQVIVAPGGRALLAAFDKAAGKPIWETPDEEKAVMSHASVMPAEIHGVKQYLHCNLKGMAAADADGKLLWRFPWKVNVAIPVAPFHLGDGRVLLTGPYNTETVVVRVTREGDRLVAEKDLSLRGGGWNSEVHTPILYDGHFFAVGKKNRGLFTCLDLQCNIVWESKPTFGLGSYILADGLFFILEGDTGMLRLMEASTSEYKELDSAPVLSGHDVWGPMALSDGKLVLRDMTTMKCIQVGAP